MATDTKRPLRALLWMVQAESAEERDEATKNARDVLRANGWDPDEKDED